ncbi:PIN domain nuclease, a component of toxin-antitoxin system (PIN domain) [Granulicella rosea]|uniref:PIN domain nuclease, a component of toxin-antitoxin system (PIN domain) n=1 Tax=Granulicella rosea TaxID=474952 RepID=A0A239M0M8_9BACT|nr:type II toxin-antitoxin system VapC family toxin [Granulicella rosea]SNT36060.1 PIN domain nuclease, a component of toxin-antitoxin system (PIN domain) [Granulicella rosea]
MRYLLDTHLLIWWASGDARCPQFVRALIADKTDDVLFSTVSVWETAIKFNLGRSDFEFHPRVLRDGLLEKNFREIQIRVEHTLGVVGLPMIHRDPFDRLLVAQARVEEITLLTVDPKVAQYPGPIRLV